MNQEWTYRVGNDPWKNLLVEEFKILDDSPEYRNPSLSSVAANTCDDWPSKTAYFEIRRFSSSTEPAQASYLVCQTGRLFLVGASLSAVRKYITCVKAWAERIKPKETSRESHDQKEPGPHYHIVLLTWHKDHISGLPELFERVEGKQITVWTSSWIWEETLRQLSNEGGGVAEKLVALDYTLPQDFESVVERGETADLRKKAVLFERTMDLALTVGVRIRMDYVPGLLPSLRVRFTCNQESIIVDPLNGFLRQKNVPSFDTWRSEFESVVSVFPMLRNKYLVRYGNLLQQQKQTPEKVRQALRDHGFWKRPQNGRLVVDTAAIGKKLAGVQFLPKPVGKARGQAPPNSEQAAEANILQKTVVVILCGGLVGRRRRELLDPGRRLSITDNEEKKYVLSILEWRLRQLYTWAETHADEGQLSVLLMTSPETEQIVKNIIEVFRKTVDPKGPDSRLDITCLSQCLIPVFKAPSPQDKLLRPDTLLDGGWQLEARGHLDLVCLVTQWAQQQENKPAVCFAFGHNNLGHLISEQTLGILRRFQRDGGYHCGIELCDLERGSSTDERWQLMSYADANARLYKPAYFKEEQDEQEGNERSYSSGVWYLNLKDQETWYKPKSKPLTTYAVSVHQEANQLHLRQDIEQLTHVEGVSVRSIKHTKPSREGLHAYDRFLVVRREDHIRNRTFHEAFEQAQQAPFHVPSPDQPEIQQAFKVMECSPAKMRYIWGGNAIASLKGIPDEFIAETWEVSTHPLGPSSLFLNLQHPVPLSVRLLSEEGSNSQIRQEHGEQFPWMVKYLDCHDALSLQVHPNAATAQYLSEKGFNVRDAWGKEESFYVIRTPLHEPFHLFFGFDREQLGPIARKLRPILSTYEDKVFQARNGDHNDSELEQCLEKLEEQLHGAIIEHCLSGVNDSLVSDGAEAASFESHFTDNFSGERGSFLNGIFRYHIGVDSEHGEGRRKSRTLLEKEYLFAALGIIRTIQLAAGYIKDRGRNYVGQCEPLFDYRKWEGYGGQEKALDRHPFFKYFRRVKMEPGTWGRVPPGTIHSWQGGGNFLIELAQRSDNTFRILDFGRELQLSSARDLHYAEAMYALTEEGILGDEALKRLIFKAEPVKHSIALSQDRTNGKSEANEADESVDQAQEQANGKSKTNETDQPTDPPKHEWVNLSKRKDWSIFMNPDGTVRLRARTQKGFSELAVGRCRTVLIASNTEVQVLPAHHDDQFLHIFSTEQSPEDWLCISLGATKLEVALWRGDESPTTRWQRGVYPGSTENGSSGAAKKETVYDRISHTVERLIDGTENGKKRQVHVAISIPGHVKRAKTGGRDHLAPNAAPGEAGQPCHSQLSCQLFIPSKMEQATAASKNSNDAAMKKDEVQKKDLAGKGEQTGAAAPMPPGGEENEAVYIYSSPLAEGNKGYIAQQEFIDKVRQSLKEAGIEKDHLLSDFLVLNDAQASALGEHQLGRFSGTRPGMVLNISSGICAGFYFGRDERTLQQRNDVSACGAVGRWLYANPYTGLLDTPWHPGDKDGIAAHIVAHVFSDTPLPYMYEDQQHLRLTSYLSSAGIALRFFSILSRTDVAGVSPLKDFLEEKIKWNPKGLLGLLEPDAKTENQESSLERFEKAYAFIQNYSDSPGKFDRLRFFEKFNEVADPENSTNNSPGDYTSDYLKREARSLIVEVASDLAEVVVRVGSMLKRLGVPSACTKHVVLTGMGGGNFGKVKADPDKELDSNNDLLLHVMRVCLSDTLGEGFSIERSERTIASRRELRGFLYYQSLRP